MAPNPYSQLYAILWTIGNILLFVGPLAFLAIVYMVLTLPLRRRERARLFLDILEVGMDAGLSPERAIVQASSTRDRIMGRRFYYLADYVESGLRLDEAISKVPRLLPPEVNAMLRAGCEIGDVRRVLPACRQLLGDALSQARGALNYVVVLAFILMPILPVMLIMASIFVLPKFEVIAQDIGTGMPSFASSVFAARGALIAASLLVMIFFQLLVICYAVGPRGRDFSYFPRMALLFDRLLWLFPWRRNRMKRDFSAMLAVALDAGLPEQHAVKLAAASTANALVIARGERIREELGRGVKLTEALGSLDDSSELKWRISNARHSRAGFFKTLHGWMQMLDAKAFQQEQSAAHVLTTFLVIANGVFIGFLVVAVFDVLIKISEEAALW